LFKLQHSGFGSVYPEPVRFLFSHPLNGGVGQLLGAGTNAVTPKLLLPFVLCGACVEGTVPQASGFASGLHLVIQRKQTRHCVFCLGRSSSLRVGTACPQVAKESRRQVSVEGVWVSVTAYTCRMKPVHSLQRVELALATWKDTLRDEAPTPLLGEGEERMRQSLTEPTCRCDTACHRRIL
jgi:hypothetical protein